MNKTYIEIDVLLAHEGAKEFTARTDKTIYSLRLDVAEIRRDLLNALEEYVKLKQEIINNYVEKKDGVPVIDGNGNVKIDPKYVNEVNDELEKINKDFEFKGLKKISLSDDKYSMLSGNELDFLMQLMEPA